MKKIIVLLLLLMPLGAVAKDVVKAAFFTSPTCGHCNIMKREFMPAFKKKYEGKIQIIEIDTSDAQGSIIFKETADAYGQEYYVPAFVVGETYMMGYPRPIGMFCDAAIEKAIANNETTRIDVKEVQSEEVFNTLTFGAIIVNGLIDGINPCAFAVIVFFVSFLAVYGYRNKEVIYVGLAYCAAVFLTYFLLGFGLFKFIYAMRGFNYVIKGFYVLTAVICLVFFFLSLYDFWIYKKTKKSDGMLLQLPKSLKLKINKVIGFFMRGNNEGHPVRITLAAFAVGFVVSLIEAMCTGQVYIPTIVLIMKDPHFRVRALSYLVLYNLMFIVPLLIVFAATIFGYKSDRVNNLFKNNLGLTKILLALVFLGLFLLLVLI